MPGSVESKPRSMPLLWLPDIFGFLQASRTMPDYLRIDGLQLDGASAMVFCTGVQANGCGW